MKITIIKIPEQWLQLYMTPTTHNSIRQMKNLRKAGHPFWMRVIEKEIQEIFDYQIVDNPRWDKITINANEMHKRFKRFFITHGEKRRGNAESPDKGG